MNLIQPLDLDDEIRLGSKFDGGYLVPLRAINTSKHLISLGYGNDFNFEKAFLSFSREKSCHLYESSISLITLVNGFLKSLLFKILGRRSFPLFQIKNLVKYLLMRATPRLKYLRRTVKKDAFSPTEISIKNVISRGYMQEETIVKIDIEGGEYEIAQELLVCAFSAIVVEVHDCYEKLEEFLSIIELAKKRFVISHIHINNFSSVKNGIPCAVEITFLNRDLLNDSDLTKKKSHLPSNLDRPCNPLRPEIPFLY